MIRIIAYIFEVVEIKVMFNIEYEWRYGKFIHDNIKTFWDITINNIYKITLNLDKINLLRDSYKLH